MLKIKDSVDLKELEKFGFKYDEVLENWVLKTNWNYVEIHIYEKSRKIITIEAGWDIPDVYYTNNGDWEISDLEKSGIIEKVEE